MNMMDYLSWRGDLTFGQSEFCEVDNLILCYLAYVNLDGIAPGMGEGAVTVKELSERFFGRYTEKDLKKDKSFIRMAPYVMQTMADTNRFGNLLVQNYVNKIDPEKMLQFAAMEILLSDGTTFVAYRGTDDTIVGWKEDFYLSKGEVLAEKEAIAYLNAVGAVENASDLDNANGLADKKIRIGGHSKGGNLAIYAAAYCKEEVQDRIIKIYNNDGPGFSKSFLESPELLRVRSRIERYIPESSIIGMLLEHVVEPTIIQSSQRGIMQHDGLSWEVMGPGFLHCEKLSNFATEMDKIIENWLANLEDEQRDCIIDDLFCILEATQASTLTELQDGGIKNVRIIMKEVEEMDSESKEALQGLLKDILQRIPKMLGIQNPFSKEK